MATPDLQSSVSMWVCLLLSVILVSVRLSLRRWRGQKFLRGDFWCVCAAVLIVARLVGNHLLVVYGSTRTISAAKRIALLNPDNASAAAAVVKGSKLALATRALLTCALWSLKMAVLDLLSRLIVKMPYERKLLYCIWITLGVTFIASFVTVFVGCQPFERHWQIYPDPGQCVVGNVWLYTYEISNIITDIMLMLVPVYLILSIRIPLMQHLRLLFLFSIGLFLIAISIIRIVQGRNSRVQRGHTLWASFEVLLATVVAVTPNIYALARNRREDSSWDKSEATCEIEEIKPHRRRNSMIIRGEKWMELADEASMIEAGILKRQSAAAGDRSSNEATSPLRDQHGDTVVGHGVSAS
ncbi:hypothetical protein ACN47E_007404 [Coniothyrium glycines]